MTRGPGDYHRGNDGDVPAKSGLELLISNTGTPGRALTEEMLIRAFEDVAMATKHRPTMVVSEFMMAMLEDKVEVVWTTGLIYGYARVRYYGKTEIRRILPDPDRDHVGRRHVSRRGKGVNAWKRAGYHYDPEYFGIFWPHGGWVCCDNRGGCPKPPTRSTRHYEGVPD